ncbi:phage tail tube protein [Candidatus Pacearchaeota archaeon]|nr:phage tail tube protein [Candidatus Pacearchaeota archaeon]
MSRITGLVEVLVNGSLVLNKEGAIARGIGVNGEAPVEREPVMGDGGIHGFTDKVIPAELETSITDRDDISLSELASINGNGTVIFRAKGGGKSYTMTNATSVGNFEVTAGQGETKIKFIGTRWIEAT